MVVAWPTSGFVYKRFSITRLHIFLQPERRLQDISLHYNTLKVSSDTLKTLKLQLPYQLAMSSAVLADKDVNAAAAQQPANHKGDVKTMEYHRQMLQSKLDEEQYVNVFTYACMFGNGL
jgi:hypothetical protein